MYAKKLSAGAIFPIIDVPKLNGANIKLGAPRHPFTWQLVIVYRGKHCPLCTRYLKELNDKLTELNALGIDVVAVSADTQQQAQTQIAEITPNYDIAYDLNQQQMQSLGLYVSEPRSSTETDHLFAEPGLFVINSEGKIQLIDISNAPFCRPDLSALVMGIKFIRDPKNQYPIRGTFDE